MICLCLPCEFVYSKTVILVGGLVAYSDGILASKGVGHVVEYTVGTVDGLAVGDLAAFVLRR